MEIWKDFPRFEGLYQLSDKGRVRSLDRRIKGTNCMGKNYNYMHRGKVLKPILTEGHPHCSLSVKGKPSNFTIRVHVLKNFGTYDSKLRIRHIDGDKLNCAIDNLEQHSDKTKCSLDLPHICNRNCGAIAKTVDEAMEIFPNFLLEGKRYYRGNCLECRNNEEKLRMRTRVKDKRYKRACLKPEKFNSCYDCGNVQMKTKKTCTECESTELTQFEEV